MNASKDAQKLHSAHQQYVPTFLSEVPAVKAYQIRRWYYRLAMMLYTCIRCIPVLENIWWDLHISRNHISQWLTQKCPQGRKTSHFQLQKCVIHLYWFSATDSKVERVLPFPRSAPHTLRILILNDLCANKVGNIVTIITIKIQVSGRHISLFVNSFELTSRIEHTRRNEKEVSSVKNKKEKDLVLWRTKEELRFFLKIAQTSNGKYRKSY